MKVRGSIIQNGRAIAQGLSITLKVQGTRWSGQVELPKGSTLMPGGYQLQLHDRRQGRIVINVIDGDTALFEGDGELKNR
jgi:hypothetical protein